MNNQPLTSQSLYQLAYNQHYKSHDLQKAIDLYNQVILQFPNSEESHYSQTQINNIQTMSELEKQKYNQLFNENKENNNQSNQLNTFQSFKQPTISTVLSFIGTIIVICSLLSSYSFLMLKLNFIYSLISLLSGLISSLIFFALSLIIRKLSYIEYTNNLILINISKIEK